MIGEIAHIVGHSPQGPRAEFPLRADRDGEENLLLLCPNHHLEIDQQPNTWSVDRLLNIKAEHEKWVRQRLSEEEERVAAPLLKVETFHSTLLRARSVPRFIYVANCELDERDVKKHLTHSTQPDIALPYIVREKKLITFTPLTDASGPFVRAISSLGEVERHDATEWWGDPDRRAWYVTLLNRALNKITGRRGLNLDKDHQRYYFDPLRSNSGEALPRNIEYQPLNNPLSTKSVVWQPKRRKTGEPRNYWIHLAVALRFHLVSPRDWVLSIRPERRFTTDGFTSLAGKATGRRATSLKSRMYNYGLLSELQFWKEYLADRQPNIILNFGEQSLVIPAELVSGVIQWPGVPGDHKRFDNVAREHDLFSSAAYERAISTEGSSPDADVDFWELQELEALESSNATELLDEEADSPYR